MKLNIYLPIVFYSFLVKYINFSQTPSLFSITSTKVDPIRSNDLYKNILY